MARLDPSPFPARALLDWYGRHRRVLPWRATGERPDPYRVWLSEIMLQQTTVVAVAPYFARFLERFPDLAALAASDEPTVLGLWAGLGYYARGRNLHRCARAVASMHGGVFPADVAALERLPGIGRYTARAIAAIAFGIAAIPVDGNVERVVSRLHAVVEPLPACRPRLAVLADAIGEDPDARANPSDFAQALFDLGATICTPRRPACALCPWRDPCRGRRAGLAETLPRKDPKRARPVRYGVVFHLEDAAGNLLLRRRPSNGLFAGMAELPGTVWRAETWTAPEALDAGAPDAGTPDRRAAWRVVGEVRHELTHLTLSLTVLAARVDRIVLDGSGGFLHARARLAEAGLPTVMRRCADLAPADDDPDAHAKVNNVML